MNEEHFSEKKNKNLIILTDRRVRFKLLGIGYNVGNANERNVSTDSVMVFFLSFHRFIQ